MTVAVVPSHDCQQYTSRCKQRLPGLGELDLSTVALQQLGVQRRLQSLDLLAECRLGEVEAAGGTGEVEFLGDGDEVAQVPQVDVHSQSRSEHVLDAARATAGSSDRWTCNSPVTGRWSPVPAAGSAKRSPVGSAPRVPRSSFTGDAPKRCTRVVESIRAEGGEAIAALANLADATECTEFVSAAQAAGPVDILINNAGAYANRSWEDASPEDWLELYAINVAAVVRCVQGFVPVMRGGGWGRIIQIGTGEAINPFPTMPDYAAAKAALLNLTVSLSKHLARSGITVNTVSPGIVVTPGVEQFYRQEASRRGWGSDWEAIEAGVLAEILDNPVGRLGRPSEVADLVAFVASPLAGYINGANLRIDGGSTAVI